MPATGRKGAAVLAAAVTAVLAVAVLALFIGGNPTSPGSVLSALAGSTDLRTTAIVWEIRVPRTAAAVAAGIGLGLAASLLQTLTRNPVADAGLLGSNAGAALVLVCAMATGAAGGALTRSLWALVGALLATAFVCAVGLSGRVYSVSRFVLVGVALGAVLTGLTNGIMLAAPTAFEGMRFWLAGSTVGVTPDSTIIGGGLIAAAALLTVCLARSLEVTLLGEELASSLGSNLLATRVAAVLAVALASATATALVGPIGFVGLLAAHAAADVARRTGTGPSTRYLLAACGGALVLVAADVIGRVALRPGELPAGIVAAVIGAPFLLRIVRSSRAIS